MRPFTIIRFICATVVLSLLACTLIIAQRAFFQGEEPEEPKNKLEALIPVNDASADAVKALVAKLEVENLPDVTPGERAFENARELLEAGDYLAAEEKLKYVNTYYPTAVSAPEARRILGEINMDRLLQGEDFSTIVQYKVKRGDSFFKIVRDHKTNLGMLMFLNGLNRIDRLHPGDTFNVMALNYRIVVDVRRQEVSIWKGPNYVKAYSIQAENLPKGSKTRKTKVAAVEALHDGKRVKLPNSSFYNADKIIALKRPQAEIRPYKGKVDDGVVGIYLDPVDIEELVLLLRSGNSVEIRY